MKKILSIAIAVLMLALCVAGCGGDTPAASSAPPASTPPASVAPPVASTTAPASDPAPAASDPADTASDPATPPPAPGGAVNIMPTGTVPELSADAAQRAVDAYAFAEALATEAAKYDRNAGTRYTMNVLDPSGSAVGDFLKAWSDAVLVITEGAVNIEVGYSNAFSTGGAMVALDDVKAGMVDFVQTLPSYYADYMPLTMAIQNPSLGIENSTVGSYAMWELYKSMPALQDQYTDDGELLFVWTNNPSPLAYKGTAEITSTGEITGNVRGNAGPAQMFIQEVGASVYACPIGDVYPNVQNGVLQYLITDWHAIHSFALADAGVCNYFLDTNIGSSAYILLCNSDTWSRIEGDGYAEAVKSVSGDYLLNLVGIWEQFEATGRSGAIEKGGTIYEPSAEMAADLETAYTNVAATWIAANGADAQAVYDKAVELVDQYNGIY